jgi:hypothetical protein
MEGREGPVTTQFDLNWAAFDQARGKHPRQKAAQQQQTPGSTELIPLSPAAQKQVALIQKKAGLPQTGQLDAKTIAYAKGHYNTASAGGGGGSSKSKSKSGGSSSAQKSAKAAAKKAKAKKAAADKKRKALIAKAKAKAREDARVQARVSKSLEGARKAQLAAAKSAAIPGTAAARAAKVAQAKSLAAVTKHVAPPRKTKSGKGVVRPKA